MAKVKDVKAALNETGVEADVKARGNGYVLVSLKLEDVDTVKAVLPSYSIGFGFDFNSHMATYQIG